MQPTALKLMKLGLIETIDCAHFLPGQDKCGRMHGHTYKIELVIEGENHNGMVIDFADLKKIIRPILAEYDHRLFNDFLDFPTVENIAELFRDRFRQVLPFAFTLRIWEGENKWCEVEQDAPVIENELSKKAGKPIRKSL